MRNRRAWLVWLCLGLFTGARIAESAHSHPNSTSPDQTCSLCIAAHSPASPAPAVNPVAAQTQCVARIIITRPESPDSRSVLSTRIRPPPVA